MLALKTRIFVHEGVEYRLVAGEPVEDVPKNVLDVMVEFGLVEKPKPVRKPRTTAGAKKTEPVKTTEEKKEPEEEKEPEVKTEEKVVSKKEDGKEG